MALNWLGLSIGSTAIQAGLIVSGVMVGLVLHFSRRFHFPHEEINSSEDKLERYNRAIFFRMSDFAPEHPNSSIYKLGSYLREAKKSIKVCVMSIDRHVPFVDILGEKHRQKLEIKVYTSANSGAGRSADYFRTLGIPVRSKKYNYSTRMHNKFVIIDDKIVITGSLNWTHNAMSCQKNNVLVLNNRRIVSEFCTEFDKLWNIYDDENNE